MRPLWLLGMLLYMSVHPNNLYFIILNFNKSLPTPRKYFGPGIHASRSICLPLSLLQAVSHNFNFFTEYVAPLGSTSLVFNFLFARFLVGTPVTRNDIYVSGF